MIPKKEQMIVDANKQVEGIYGQLQYGIDYQQ